MKRALAALVFALALSGATLAGSGLVVAPHVDPPGTPLVHDHVLAAYRFPIFLLRLQDRLYRGERFSLDQSAMGAGSAALVLALLTFTVPRLPRPARRAVARLALPAIRPAQWRPELPLAPPRTGALRSDPA